MDVRDFAKVQTELDEIAARHGKIDAVVLTAGVLRTGLLQEATDDEIAESIGINYSGAISVARASYRHLAATKGHLLLFTSSSYTRGRERYALYSSTKAAIVNLTQALAEEWSKEGIKVNVVNPERTATPMRTQAFGLEEPNTLLSPEAVAESSVDVITSASTGHVFDVRLPETTPR